MRTIVAGSRDGISYKDVCEAILSCPWSSQISEIVSGGARGADSAGEYFAKYERRLPVKIFLADWNTHGRAAGHIRNAQMAEYAHALILVWDGRSTGSKNMLVNARKARLKIYEKIVTN